MRRSLYALVLLTISIVFLQCQKEKSSEYRNPLSRTGQTGLVQGNIIDETGAPASGVSISIGNRTAVTDGKGFFRISNAPVDRNGTVVIAEKTGYFKALRTFLPGEGTQYVKIQLIARKLTGLVSASGGTVNLPNGSSVTLPAAAAVTAGGTSYTGKIRIYAAYIDPADLSIRNRLPGSFIAESQTGRRVALASFGMLAVELESESGEKLQLAPGKKATVLTAIPAALRSKAPQSIPLWYLNEQTGIWKEEGLAVREGEVYKGEVSHFSFWNCDVPMNAIDLSMTIRNTEGQPLRFVCVKITSEDGGGFAYGYTDSLGQVNGFVPAGERLRLECMDECGKVVYSQQAGPYNTNTNLGIISISVSDKWHVSIRGKLLSCNGAAVSKGLVIVYYDNNRYAARTDQSGQFITGFIHCGSSSLSVEVVAVDEQAKQQSAAINYTVNGGENNLGSITACGNSALTYINFNLDGSDFQVSDSLSAYTSSSQIPALPYRTSFSGFNVSAPGENAWVSFNHSNQTGTFPVEFAGFNNSNTATIIRPFDVTLTKVPVSAGDFWEGTFAGKYKDSAQNSPVRTVSGSFRIRK